MMDTGVIQLLLSGYSLPSFHATVNYFVLVEMWNLTPHLLLSFTLFIIHNYFVRIESQVYRTWVNWCE